MKGNKIKYGEKDHIKGELDYNAAKIKVSVFLDGDLLQAIKVDAKATNQKYQSLINQALREVFLREMRPIDPNDYQQLKQRVEILEKAFLKKQA